MQGFKAGIVTFTNVNNYGCILQRYALQTTLQTLGISVESLVFTPTSHRRITKPVNHNIHRLCSPKFLVFQAKVILSRIITSFGKKQLIQKTRFFENFDRRFLINTKPLKTFDDLIKEGMRFSVLIAGSDQIWNPDLCPTEEFFQFHMLNFVPYEKKISYGASIGLSQLSEEVVPKFRHYLSDFSWISVREKEGADELERILDRPIDVVLDPTMLLSSKEWNKLANQSPTVGKPKSSYILCYVMQNFKDIINKAYQIQKYHNFPILCICSKIRDYLLLKLKHRGVTPIFAVDPGEFVSLFENSSFVVTDSFHGTVFSILNHKPFFTMLFDKKSQTKSRNSRILTLLSTFQLESRLFGSEDKSPLKSESFEIDYKTVDNILQELRRNSLNKLEKAIENVVTRTVNT